MNNLLTNRDIFINSCFDTSYFVNYINYIKKQLNERNDCDALKTEIDKYNDLLKSNGNLYYGTLKINTVDEFWFAYQNLSIIYAKINSILHSDLLEKNYENLELLKNVENFNKKNSSRIELYKKYTTEINNNLNIDDLPAEFVSKYNKYSNLYNKLLLTQKR